MILEKEKIVIVHPPRCGGSSLEHHFFGSDWQRKNLWMKHRSASEYAQALSLMGLNPNEYKFFCLYRDPVERIRSMYRTGYWRWSNKLLGRNLGEFFFYLTLRPANHEGANLMILDYGNSNVEWIQLPQLCDRLGITQSFSSHEEKSDKSIKQLPYSLVEGLSLPLFLGDLLTFNRHVSLVAIVISPISLSFFLAIRFAQWVEQRFRRTFRVFKQIMKSQGPN